MSEAKTVAERVARASYGKLVAILARKTGDITLAEDAMGEAFARALLTWPERGVPRNPEGWLVTVARNVHLDQTKSAAERSRREVPFEVLEALPMAESAAFPDRRFALMFACAHPAIQTSVRAPLMMQVVLGLDVKDIATAYLMPSATLAQRLVRAKRKIRVARIPIDVPDDLAVRLPPVLEAIYAASALGWSDDDTALEALYLAQLVVEEVSSPAALGLCALLCFSASRRRARVQGDVLIPTSEQDEALWDRAFLQKGRALLEEASRAGLLDRFQLEAAIEDALSVRAFGSVVDHHAIAQLYDGLLQVAPSIGAMVARAAAVGEAFGAQAGLEALESCAALAKDYPPYWATLAHLLRDDGRDARAAFDKAISLSTWLPARRYLEQQRRRLPGREGG